MRLYTTLLSVLITFSIAAQKTINTRFEQSKGTQTPTYFEIIDWWQKLDTQSGKVKMLTMGMTDAGYPLHLVVVAQNGDYNFDNIHKNNKRVILINNGIHPGEPDGIDASMLLVRDIVTNKIKIPDNVVLAIIPIYNIGGCLNRSANYRVDQNGPEEFGFRGNSQNLDLNRDFIKCDSKDAKAFTEIFHLTDPDVFVDNHVSNGADYQHIMTLLTSQHNKLGGEMGDYLNNDFEPALYSLMKSKGYDLIPYVNIWNNTPDKGWAEYWDSPRYGSGYGSLWNTFSFVPETHMLKTYDQRVRSTYALMQCFIEFTSENSGKIKQLRTQAKELVKKQEQFPISWKLDRSKFKEVIFKGYEAGYKASEVSGLQRLYYDRSKPYEKKIPIYNYFPATEFVSKPKAYIIPQGWWKVIELLKLNKVQMSQFKKDTALMVEVYKIEDYKTMPRQYEMHHLNSDAKLSIHTQTINFRKGDWYIPMNQEANRFLIETLEPNTTDSYFAWNFFDAILGQKEGFSAYAFEDIAADYLKQNPDLRNKLEEKRTADTAFAKNGGAQLNFVFENSPWYETAHMIYPVYRVK
ncbi:MAG TPA: M14 family metallopeptidase [Chitinophagaceae bacterium]|nr:M14 family metallopeptidase [Chitinophagaceae bacterium]